MGQNPSRSLEKAIKDGKKVKILKYLRNRKTDVNATNEDGDTLLHMVFRNSKFAPIALIELLITFLDRGGDIKIKNNNHETILHMAVARRVKSSIHFLLKHNAEIDVSDSDGNSLTHYFIDNEFERIMSFYYYNLGSADREKVEKDSANYVEWLLSNGFNFDSKNEIGQSALYWAIGYNLQHILPHLLRHTTDINFLSTNENRNLLQLFIKASNNKETRNDVIKYFAPRNITEKLEFIRNYEIWSDNYSPLYAVEIIEILLNRGVSVDHVDKDGFTALEMAIDSEVQLEVIYKLLVKFTKIEDKCSDDLVHHVVNKATYEYPLDSYYSSILRALVARGCNLNNLNKSGIPPIYFALSKGNLSLVQLMKEMGADLAFITRNGQNLLFALFSKSWGNDINYEAQEGIFDMLVKEGCNVNTVDKDGRTLLHLASKHFYYTGIAKLLKLGIDINCQDKIEGKTPLHLAVEQGHLELAKYLLDMNADIDSTDLNGNRPLHLTCDEDMLKMLLSQGALVNARNNKGETVLTKVIRLGRNKKSSHFEYISKCIDELLVHGADVNEDCITRLAPHHSTHHCNTILFQHWIKLKAAGLPCSKHYEAFIETEFDRKMKEDCTAEIELLKATFIDNLSTSLYDWLHLHPNRRCRHVHDEKLRNFIYLLTLKHEYPLYLTVILGYYNSALTRESLMKSARDKWTNCTKFYLPDVCLEYIFAYLHDGDLISIVDVQ